MSQISELYRVIARDDEYVGDTGDESDQWRTLWGDERSRLVRLCARLTGDADAAEDLAQEALLEAWRHRDMLRDPEKRLQWLSGVARNVCLRWARQLGRRLAHEASSGVGVASLDGDGFADASPTTPVIEPADEFDLEIELERHELVTLLDRALASLPPETRGALVAHYVEDSPLAEIAARLGASASAIAMRLQRGKLALRRVLTTDFSADLAAYGLGAVDAGRWEETRLWCPVCVPSQPHSVDDDEQMWVHTHSRLILGGVTGYKRAINRLNSWVADYYYPNLSEGHAPCPDCGYLMRLHVDLTRPDDIPRQFHGESPGVYHWRPICRAAFWESLHGLLLATPVGRAFNQRYPRMRALPHTFVEAEGRAAIVSPFESVTTGERLTLISATDTFELVRVYGSPGIPDSSQASVSPVPLVS